MVEGARARARKVIVVGHSLGGHVALAAQATGASFAADPTGQTAFTTVGATPVSNLADLSLGVTLLKANNLSLSARYELQAARGFVSQTGSLRLRQLF